MDRRKKTSAARRGFTRLRTLRRGFTLVEVLFMVTIIVIILATVTVALDPLEKQRRARNVRRMQDLEAIGTALKLAKFDAPEHSFFSAFDADTYKMLTNGDVVCPEEEMVCASFEAEEPTVPFSGCIDLSLLTAEGYLPVIPMDPKFSGSGITLYVARWGRDLELVSCSPEEQGTDDVLPSIELIL